MTRTTDDKLEIRVDRALRPLINREVLLTVGVQKTLTDSLAHTLTDSLTYIGQAGQASNEFP